MVKVKANELDSNDNALVRKLHKEVQHLRQVLNLRKKGKVEEIQRQLVTLQKENWKLRELAQNSEEVERLKLENKIMRLELQKMRYEEGSGGENQSFLGSVSQLDHHIENNSMDRYAAQSEYEKPIREEMPVK
jgi:predicted nuclease with TOPRIM domain